MTYEKLKINVYYDPPSEYPHSSRNHAEDFQDYVLPLGRMHNATLHDRGIAGGLEAAAAAGASEIVIQPGVAIDGAGQFIVLSPDGHGNIGADPPHGNNNEVQVPVHLPLAAATGTTVYVTVQFAQILRSLEGSGGRQEQVPWIRLQPTTGAGAYVDDGTSVILAIAAVDGAGKLTSLKEADAALPFARRSVGLTAGELRVRRSAGAANQLQETPSGKLKAGPGGGLQLTVPNAGDSVTLMQESGANLASVEMRANKVSYVDGSGRPAIQVTSGNATLDVGVQGIGGRVLVHHAGGPATVTLDGNNGSITASTISAASASGMDVNTGALRVHANDFVLDGRSGGNKRALVDWNNRLIVNFNGDYAQGVQIGGNVQVVGQLTDGSGQSLMGNPVGKFSQTWMFCGASGTVVQDVDLGASRRFTAFVAIMFIDSLGPFDRDNAVAAEVYMIDGRPTFNWINGGDHLGPSGADANVHAPTVSGVGRVIRFRARCWADANLAAIGIVFFE